MYQNSSPLSGRNRRVWEFVHRDPRTDEFARKMLDLVQFSLPQYEKEGKAYLNIAIGCTGGQHRSVALSEDLAAQLREGEWRVVVRHRDMREETAPVVPSLAVREEVSEEITEDISEAISEARTP